LLATYLTAQGECVWDLSKQELKRRGGWTFFMGKTLRKHIQENFDWSMSFAEGRPAFILQRQGVYQGSRPINPCGQRCCGSSKKSSQNGWSWSNPLLIETLSLDGLPSFNSVVTGSLGELLTANTGCPSNVPAGLSSEEWELLGWPYGITYTLTASEAKGGAPKAGRANYTFGAVPTVCQAEYLQGFPRGYLHLWGLETLSAHQSLGLLHHGSSILNKE
jgi:hypothetical protein